MKIVFEVEPTDYCNVKCPLCAREKTDAKNTSSLTREQIEKVIKPDNTKNVVLSGLYGDPLISPHILDILDYFEENRISSKINTNGSFHDASFWTKIAKYKFNYIVFWNDDFYRVNQDSTLVLKNAKTYIQNGGHATWGFIPFEHNYKFENKFREIAKDMGFSAFLVKPSRDTSSEDTAVKLVDIKVEYKEDDEVIKCDFLHKGRINLDSKGTIMPCCWIHEMIRHIFPDWYKSGDETPIPRKEITNTKYSKKLLERFLDAFYDKFVEIGIKKFDSNSYEFDEILINGFFNDLDIKNEYCSLMCGTTKNKSFNTQRKLTKLK